MLEEDAEVRFEWYDTQELRDLGASLSRLAEKNARNNRSLRAHARQLEESNRYKSEFLANVSHELRTPLNSILLLSKLLAEDTSELSPDKARQARVIHAAGKDLQSLIEKARPVDAQQDLKWEGMQMFTRHGVPLDDPRMESGYGHYEENLVSIIETLRGKGMHVVLSSVPVNLRHSAPFLSVHNPNLPQDTGTRERRGSQQSAHIAKPHGLGKFLEDG